MLLSKPIIIKIYPSTVADKASLVNDVFGKAGNADKFTLLSGLIKYLSDLKCGAKSGLVDMWDAGAVGVPASATLTLTGQPLDNDSIVIGGVSFVAKASNPNVAQNEFLIGPDTYGTIANLVNLINNQTNNATIKKMLSAKQVDATHMDLVAEQFGDEGNIIATAVSGLSWSFGATFFTGGQAGPRPSLGIGRDTKSST